VRRAAPLLLIALLVAACSTFGEPAAATVDGVEIGNDLIDRDLEAIRSNELYQQSLEGQFGVSLVAEEDDDVNASTAFVAQLLSLRVYVELLEQQLEDDGVDIDDDALLEDVRSGFETQTGNIFDEFDEAYQRDVVHQQAVIQTFEDTVRAEVGSDAEELYERDPDAFAEICVSHALVGVQGGRTPEEAEARAAELRAEIESGDRTFEDVATNDSDDTFAAEGAGDLGCGSQLSLQFDPTFEAAAFGLDEGEVSEPVVTQFGAHLILVTAREIPDLDEVVDPDAVVASAIEQRFRERLIDVLCSGDVSVSRYGTWNTDPCRDLASAVPRVEPPEGPIQPEPEPGIQFEL